MQKLHSRGAEAESLLDQHGSAFFESGEESAADLVRLRLAALVHQLRPIEARIYAERALAEAGEMSARTRARIMLLQAQNSIVLGQWFEAGRLVQQGLAVAEEAGDAALQRSFDELLTNFSLPVDP